MQERHFHYTIMCNKTNVSTPQIIIIILGTFLLWGRNWMTFILMIFILIADAVEPGLTTGTTVSCTDSLHFTHMHSLT